MEDSNSGLARLRSVEVAPLGRVKYHCTFSDEEEFCNDLLTLTPDGPKASRECFSGTHKILTMDLEKGNWFYHSFWTVLKW